MSAQVLHHRLYIAKPEQTLDFYQRCLGMRLETTQRHGAATHYFLAYTAQGRGKATPEMPFAFLELIHDTARPAPEVRAQPDHNEGYWKFSLAVADLDCAVASLRRNGVDVSEPVQIEDVAYLAFTQDPEGYAIELIAHFFKANHPPKCGISTADNKLVLNTAASLALIALRVLDIDRSLGFYQDQLGMRLLSRQRIEALGISLYFLAFDNDAAPIEDVDSVDIREWLWQRPYAQIELVHNWRTPVQALRVSADSGFAGVTLACPGQAKGVLIDPDGHKLINRC